MASPASIGKHPIHPMLVAFPIGLWVFALVCDMVRFSGESEIWSTLALYSIAGGIVGGILAAIPGVIDYFSIDEPEMKRTATFHMALGLSALAIFTLDLLLRLRVHEGSAGPFLLSIAGVLVMGIGGWLGGEMVYVKGMGVEAVEQLNKEKDKHAKKRKTTSKGPTPMRRAG
jgi:uncharacterized membrane protein